LSKLFIASLILVLPASLPAQSLSDTHEFVTTPGKAQVHVRPLVQNQAKAINCHPEASKAVTCEAHARLTKAQALANARGDKVKQLSQR
jgi:hypothetical protein